MAQQYHLQQHAGGGRGGGGVQQQQPGQQPPQTSRPGGRGPFPSGGRGGPYNPAYGGGGRGGGGPRPHMGAWQPTAPTSLQQAAAAAANYQVSQQQQQHHPSQGQPPQGQPQPPSGQPPQPQGQPQAIPPQHQQGAGGRGPYPLAAGGYGAVPAPYYNPYAGNQPYRGSWQQGSAGLPPQQGAAAGPAGAGAAGPMAPSSQMRGNMRGGVFYPQPPQPLHPGAVGAMHSHHPTHHFTMGGPTAGATGVPMHTPHHQPPAPREKKPLKITDKDGNPLDLTKAAPKKASDGNSKSSLQQAAAKEKTESVAAGDKLRQAALERINAEENAKKKKIDEEEAQKKKAEAEVKARIEAEEKAKQEAEEKTRKEAEEKARLEAEEKARKEAEEKARLEEEENARKEAEEKARLAAEEKARKEAEEKARLEAEEMARMEAEEKARLEAENKASKDAEERKLKEMQREAEEKKENDTKEAPTKEGSSLAAAAHRMATPEPGKSKSGGKRLVYAKDELMRLKELDVCKERPETLPDMTVSRGNLAKGKSERSRGGNRGDGGGGNRSGSGGGNNDWNRPPQQRRQTSQGGSDGKDWSRGQAPPKPQQNQRNRSKGGRGGNQVPLYDGPVAPLVKTENHWRPRKNTSAKVVTEKKVKAILNKMTKEKFDKLSAQMMEIEILSYDILTMMIDNVYDKAIDEPTFGDMYADLCAKLSQSAQEARFVHIIESDEEPPTEDGAPPAAGESSANSVYRWSNDVSTTDSEIVGPFASPAECIDVALSSEGKEPVERGEMELELVSVDIRKGTFVKVMKKKDAPEGEKEIYYTVYFPVAEAKECGQQLSDLFLSQPECSSDAVKKNSFKRCLLNKCEEEFNKQDIYVDWKKEKQAYEESKDTLKESERAEKEEELDFRRIRIKKQMLGNVKFIGQLYKKNLLKERIMRYCIATMLKLTESKEGKSKNHGYEDTGQTDMDEEDHEAICSMFTTIGSTIDTPAAADFMTLCFTKIRNLSVDPKLPMRSRFMYKDLLELRSNKWVPRRKEEKAKTIEEIRKDFEREERRKEQESLASRGNTKGNDFRGQRPVNDYRGSTRQQSSGNRPRQPKPVTETDEDGFTVIGTKGTAPKTTSKTMQQQVRGPPVTTNQKFAALSDENAAAAGGARTEDAPTPSKQPEPMSDEMLERRIKGMRTDFIADGGNEAELLLSMDEMSGTPDAGLKLIQKSADALVDCKAAERQAITRIISILFTRGKLSQDVIQDGLVDAIEFVDSMVLDSPRLYEYFGDLLGELFRIKAIDMLWFCEQLEKTKVDPDTLAPERLVQHTLTALKALDGMDAVKAATSDEEPLVNLLGADKWASIQRSL